VPASPTETSLIAYSTLSDACYQRLKERIIGARELRGTQLDINALASEFGVSRAPVVKAIERLAFEGLVTVSPHRGSFVARPTRADVHEVVEVRVALERASLEAAWQRTPRALVNRLLDNEASLARTALDDGPLDQVAFVAYDRAFHQIIAEESGNGRLLRLYDIIRSQIELFRTQTFGEDVARRSLTRHGQVIEALVAADAGKAIDLLVQHIREVGDIAILIAD
jgi:GntR family transcriptional regulator, rspAB operon transcriptional repressor